VDKELWVAFTQANSAVARDILTHSFQWQVDDSATLPNGNDVEIKVDEVALSTDNPSECPSIQHSSNGDSCVK
jgi:hypothetical protein